MRLPVALSLVTGFDDSRGFYIEHYVIMPMQYTAIFTTVNFFLIFAYDIDCEVVLSRTHN